MARGGRNRNRSRSRSNSNNQNNSPRSPPTAASSPSLLSPSSPARVPGSSPVLPRHQQQQQQQQQHQQQQPQQHGRARRAGTPHPASPPEAQPQPQQQPAAAAAPTTGGANVDLLEQTLHRRALAEQMIDATKEGDVGRVQALLMECPQLACCRDSVGQSPLMWASYKGFRELAALLVDAGAPLDDFRCQSSRSALYMACEFGNWNVAELLLQKGANPSFRRQLYGRTCLQIAAYNNHANVVKGMLECGTSDIDAVDNHGSSALHLAIRDDHQYQPAVPTDISETVLILLQHGADPLSRDHAGFTPLALARGLNHARCIELLQDWERQYLLTRARWLLKEAPLVERAVVEQGLSVVEEAPAFTQGRLKKKAVRVSIFGFQRRDETPVLPTVLKGSTHARLLEAQDGALSPAQVKLRHTVEDDTAHYVLRDMKFETFLQLQELFHA